MGVIADRSKNFRIWGNRSAYDLAAKTGRYRIPPTGCQLIGSVALMKEPF